MKKNKTLFIMSIFITSFLILNIIAIIVGLVFLFQIEGFLWAKISLSIELVLFVGGAICFVYYMDTVGENTMELSILKQKLIEKKILDKKDIDEIEDLTDPNENKYFCPKCGKEVNPDDEYCGHCQTKIYQ